MDYYVNREIGRRGLNDAMKNGDPRNHVAPGDSRDENLGFCASGNGTS